MFYADKWLDVLRKGRALDQPEDITLCEPYSFKITYGKVFETKKKKEGSNFQDTKTSIEAN